MVVFSSLACCLAWDPLIYMFVERNLFSLLVSLLSTRSFMETCFTYYKSHRFMQNMSIQTMVFFFNSIYLYFLMMLHHAACEILVCDQGLSRSPLQGKRRALTREVPKTRVFTQWFLVYSQGCAAINTTQFQNIVITLKRNSVSLSSHHPFSPPSRPWQALI